MTRGNYPANDPRAGFALLMVYAMAATVAVMLYMQLPRVAFEAQRNKEQLLIDRGEQYSRAVQLYVRKFQRYPVDIAALESTQNLRFLRKQYVDPMTGKSEWRLIHVGPGGVFTDSQVYGNKQKKDQTPQQTFITELNPTGAGGMPAEGVNLATRRRPSDQPGAAGDPNSAGSGNSGQPGAPPAPAPVMVLPDGRIVPATPNGVPAPSTNTPGQQGQPTYPGQQGFGGGQPAQPGQPGQPMQGGFPAGFQNQANAPPTGAANLINQILTTPRQQPGQPSQGGAVDAFGNPVQNPGAGQMQTNAFPNLNVGTGVGNSNGGTGTGNSLGGTVVGGGIAGVASKYEQEGIKLYKERSAYNEWEFVYDMTKDRTRNGGQVQNGAVGGQVQGGAGSGTGTGTISK